MIPLGLSAARQREFNRALLGHHTVVPVAHVLTLDHKLVADVSDMVVDGSVNFSNDAETTRSAQVSLFDPHGHIGFGDNDPSKGAMFLDNMMRLQLSIDWPGNSDAPVDVPIFTGPVVALDRDAWTISVECLGKEHFALRRAWEPITYSVNYTTDLIRWLLRRSGETRMDIPDLKLLTTDYTTIWPNSQLWKHAQKLARSIDRQLFYDGRGIARLRKIPSKPVWTFTDGENGSLTERPKVSYDVANVINRVWVVGKKPKGKPRFEGSAHLPRANPYSEFNLGRGPDKRGGVLLHRVENDRMRTNRNCHEHAVKLLNRINRQQINTDYTALCVPHLEEGDPVELDCEDMRLVHTARNFSIPLTGGAMSVGNTRNLRRGPKAKLRLLQSMQWGYNGGLMGATWDTTGTAEM